jgi:hypothetical protein
VTAVAGFDISTREITCAIIPLDPTTPTLADGRGVAFRSELVTVTRDDGVRYRDIREAVRVILGPSPYDVQLAYVERPWSRFAKSIAPMMGVYGAVMASIPRHIARAGISPAEWRHTLGLPQRISKTDATDRARVWLATQGVSADALTEHQADALFVALAGRQLNHRAWSEGAA